MAANTLPSMAAILVLVITCFLGGLVSDNNLVAFGQCESQIPGIISSCVQYVAKDGPEIPPSQACCDVLNTDDMPCLCKHVTNDFANHIDLNKALYVIQYCGVTSLQHGTQCGSYTIP